MIITDQAKVAWRWSTEWVVLWRIVGKSRAVKNYQSFIEQCQTNRVSPLREGVGGSMYVRISNVVVLCLVGIELIFMSFVPISSCHLSLFNPFTAKFSQMQILTKFPNFIVWQFGKQIASCVSTGKELSFEWSHYRIWSTDWNVRVILQISIEHSGSERMKSHVACLNFTLEAPH